MRVRQGICVVYGIVYDIRTMTDVAMQSPAFMRAGYAFPFMVYTGQGKHTMLQKESKRKGQRSMKCELENGRVEERLRRKHILAEMVTNILCERFGQELSHPELMVIADFICSHFGLQLDRDAMRRKKALLAWCAEHFTEFTHVIACTVGERAENGKIITVGNNVTGKIINMNPMLFNQITNL